MSSEINRQNFISQQASEYVTRLYSGELTAKEELEITTWCEASDVNRAAFEQALAIWEVAPELSQKSSWRDKLERRFYHLRYFAASVFLVAACFLLFLKSESTAPKESLNIEQHYATATGEVSNIGLSDGSQITLNTATEIKVNLTRNKRELWLEKGEAFFDIAKDKSRPFLIYTNAKTVRVVGTKFNIKLSESGFDISVSEGVVAVESDNPPTSVPEHTPLYLEAGAVASFKASSSLVTKKNDEKVEKAHSWRSGYLRFDDEQLAHVIDSFNRYRSKKITIDESAANLKISGVFKLSDGDAILTALEATLPIHIEETEKNIKIVKK
ncbi:FecR family protein [Alteromonas sp. S015]|uniref:FecR family protein n=1 Tax=Alteromonas sp. S015 TaxID=3117401 RepID=UPI002FDFB2B3